MEKWYDLHTHRDFLTLMTVSLIEHFKADSLRRQPCGGVAQPTKVWGWCYRPQALVLPGSI